MSARQSCVPRIHSSTSIKKVHESRLLESLIHNTSNGKAQAIFGMYRLREIIHKLRYKHDKTTHVVKNFD